MNSQSANTAFRAQLVMPEQREVYDLWMKKSSGGKLPNRTDFSPRELLQFLPRICLVNVGGGQEPTVRLAGTAIRDIYDREITGLRLGEFLENEELAYWHRAYGTLCEHVSPAQGALRGTRAGKEHMVQFWLRLPLGNDKNDVTMVLCHDICVPAMTIQDENKLMDKFSFAISA